MCGAGWCVHMCLRTCIFIYVFVCGEILGHTSVVVRTDSFENKVVHEITMSNLVGCVCVFSILYVPYKFVPQ